MIDTLEKPAPLQGFIDKWLAAQPQQHVALAFVDGGEYPGHLALAAWEQEMLDAAYGAREPQAVVAKLRWWIAELISAPGSDGEHPLTQVLYSDPHAQAISSVVWTAPVHAAMAQLDQGTAPDFAVQLVAAQPLHGALAALETAWWFGAQADPTRATGVSILAHLLHALRRLPQDVERDCLPLPMDRLAQHGLGRADLREPTPARDAAVKAQLRDLLQQWRAVKALPGPLSVFRAVEFHQCRQVARRALAAADSLAALEAQAARSDVWLALHAWRAARAWQRSRRVPVAPVAEALAVPL